MNWQSCHFVLCGAIYFINRRKRVYVFLLWRREMDSETNRQTDRQLDRQTQTDR